MKLLDRYVLRSFLEPFVICFLGFIGIWLIFDLSGNLQDFREAGASLKQIGRFYATQVPQIIVISLPVGVLLALLFSLSRMSRSNEIISMLTAGRSVARILAPLMAVGLLATGACVVLNYEWAPHAEGAKKALLDQMHRGKKSANRDVLEAQVFRDRQNHRTWFIRKMRLKSPQLEDVHITQQDVAGNISSKWYARRAIYDAQARSWTLKRGMRVDFTQEGDIATTEDFADAHVVSDWTETPQRIASSRLDAQNLSIPELREYLVLNGDFPAVQLAPYRTYLVHRWAFPWQCFIVVLIGAPLAIAFSRRGVVGGVAGAMLGYSGLLLSTYLFLALGKGYRLSSELAAWIPNVAFALIGLVLLHFRSTNRDLPSLSFRKK